MDRSRECIDRWAYVWILYCKSTLELEFVQNECIDFTGSGCKLYILEVYV
jgi:hypothetical protein